MNKIDKYLKTNPVMIKAVVAYTILNEKVLLGVRKTSSTNLGINTISGIGGKLEENESFDDALIRELNEEVGIIPIKFRNMGKVKFLNPSNTKWNLDVTVYLIDKWDGKITESESIKPQWFPINNVPFDKMFIDNKYWVPQVLSGKKVDATFIFSKEHKSDESRINFSD